MIFWKTTSEIKNSKTKELHFKRFCYFSCKWFGIYKHIIMRADEDKHEHDHPWDFLSFILEGSYSEFVDSKLFIRNRFSLKVNDAEFHHKLANVMGPNKRCVTFVITGPRRRNWGYKTSKGWIDNETYRVLKREDKLPD